MCLNIDHGVGLPEYIKVLLQTQSLSLFEHAILLRSQKRQWQCGKSTGQLHERHAKPSN
jgi:hypothetical protein